MGLKKLSKRPHRAAEKAVTTNLRDLLHAISERTADQVIVDTDNGLVRRHTVEHIHVAVTRISVEAAGAPVINCLNRIALRFFRS